MQYLLLIHNNSKSPASEAEWSAFIARAMESGTFRGGSEVGVITRIGRPGPTSEHIGGYMRFDSDDRQKLLDLLQSHPVVLHGGTVELCEMPKS